MSPEIGWRFPPTNGGRVDGFNDPGIAHFSGAPLSSLARETIQNSLDAGRDTSKPVHVSFELIDLDSDSLGRDELWEAIVACRQQADGDAMVEPALVSAQKIIAQDTVPCLRVSDRNTIGLRGDHWRALVKMQGVSFKPELEGAGGSHGIGKYAPFAVSGLRTVFYWTCYQEEGEEKEQFQGKSVLMSHQSEDQETQGTGFYGIKEGCLEVGSQIPERFRVFSKEGRPVYGTSLAIAGFQATEDWRLRIAASVIENFFYAIARGKLTVDIEPEDEDLLEIEQESLGDWFARLLDKDSDEDSGSEDGSALKQARSFWEISNASSSPIEKQDKDLGHCRLWIQVAEGLPSKVAFVRQTGMLVTTEQKNLIRFPGFRDFAALCVFEDPSGNELLRRMENPQHNQFEPDRLPNHDRVRGRQALRRTTDWIRDEVRKQAGPPREVNRWFCGNSRPICRT